MVRHDRYTRELLREESAEKYRNRAAPEQGLLFEDSDMKEIIRAAQVREAAHANRRKKK